MKEVTLRFAKPRKRKNRKIINRLLRQGYSLRFAINEEAARFDRR